MVPSVVVFVVTKIWTIGVVKEGVWWLRTCEQLKWERRGDLNAPINVKPEGGDPGHMWGI